MTQESSPTARVADHGPYFFVEIDHGLDYPTIIFTLSHIFQTRELREKNHLWLFPEERTNIDVSMMAELRNFICRNCPEPKDDPLQAAVVTKSGFQRSLVEMFADMPGGLPFALRSFFDIEAARAWLTHPQ